ncbi:MAG: SCP2 sterol-binding domain-containing protein [Candidatus Thorarchaeota archaeon]
MPFFESAEQMQDVFEEFWKRATQQTEVMEKLAKSKVVVRFDIEQPELHITINFRDPDSEGNYGTLSFDMDTDPEISVWSTSETTNKFWAGKLKTTVAMARGQVKLQGSVAKALGLLSKIKPLYDIWPEVLKDKGLDHMLV